MQVERHTSLAYAPVAQAIYDSYLPGWVRRANEMLGLGYPMGGTGWLPGSALLTLTLTTVPLRNGPVLAQQGAQSAGGREAYLYGPGSIGQFDAEAEYYLTGGSGTVRQTTDVTGTVTLARTYTPFGAVLQ